VPEGGDHLREEPLPQPVGARRGKDGRSVHAEDGPSQVAQRDGVAGVFGHGRDEWVRPQQVEELVWVRICWNRSGVEVLQDGRGEVGAGRVRPEGVDRRGGRGHIDVGRRNGLQALRRNAFVGFSGPFGQG